MYRLRFLKIFAAAFLLPFAAYAQSDSVAVVAEEPVVVVSTSADSAYVSGIKVEPADEDSSATEGKSYVYQGAYISADIFNPIASAFNGGRFQFEVMADVSLWHKLFPAIEYGMMFYNPTSTDYSYSTNGFFFRLGAGYNLINNKPNRKYDHAVILGARYAVGNVNYTLSNATVHDNYWGTDDVVNASALNATVGWVEFVVLVRVQLYKGLFMGLGVRLQTFPHIYGSDINYPAFVPGFGAYSEGTTNWSYNISFAYRFPYKKNTIKIEND